MRGPHDPNLPNDTPDGLWGERAAILAREGVDFSVPSIIYEHQRQAIYMGDAQVGDARRVLIALEQCELRLSELNVTSTT
jgi:hypothetical protein